MSRLTPRACHCRARPGHPALLPSEQSFPYPPRRSGLPGRARQRQRRGREDGRARPAIGPPSEAPSRSDVQPPSGWRCSAPSPPACHRPARAPRRGLQGLSLPGLTRQSSLAVLRTGAVFCSTKRVWVAGSSPATTTERTGGLDWRTVLRRKPHRDPTCNRHPACAARRASLRPITIRLAPQAATSKACHCRAWPGNPALLPSTGRFLLPLQVSLDCRFEPGNDNGEDGRTEKVRPAIRSPSEAPSRSDV